MKKDAYYTSGQFAKKAHVTLRAIRYYDKQNILKPSARTAAGALWSISVSLSETFKTPPLCFVTQNIGEVARSDGRVENSLSSAGLYWTNHIFTIRLGDPLQEQPIQ